MSNKNKKIWKKLEIHHKILYNGNILPKKGNIMKVNVKRKTTESEILVNIDFSELSADYRSKINTPYPFLNHMLEHIAYRAGITIETDVKFTNFVLSHVVYEDLGIALGKALRAYIIKNYESGIIGFGDGIGIIDEAYSTCAISFEERAYFNIESEVVIPDTTEDVLSEDLFAFIEGIAQGGRATIHVNLRKGINGHHIFEAIFRSIGTTLKNVLSISEERKNLTSGVAGKIDWEIEIK